MNEAIKKTRSQVIKTFQTLKTLPAEQIAKHLQKNHEDYQYFSQLMNESKEPSKESKNKKVEEILADRLNNAEISIISIDNKGNSNNCLISQETYHNNIKVEIQELTLYLRENLEPEEIVDLFLQTYQTVKEKWHPQSKDKFNKALALILDALLKDSEEEDSHPSDETNLD